MHSTDEIAVQPRLSPPTTQDEIQALDPGMKVKSLS